MKKFLYLLAKFVFFWCLAVTSAQAKEGFNLKAEALMVPISKAWDSTFIVLGDKGNSYKVGTAFLVKKELHDNSTTLYFLTSEHFLRPFCAKKGLCKKTFLAQNADLLRDGKTTRLRSLQGLVFDQIELVQKSRNPDLALLKVSLSSQQRKFPDPIVISNSCFLQKGEPLYSIGFPDISVRNFPSLVAIENQESIRKRWSTGVFVRFNKSDFNDNSKTQRWAGTTVDALGGNSGGPLLNKYGEVVGVMKNSASTPENKLRYMGNENPEELSWQSNAVRCEYLAKFVKYLYK